MSTQRCCKIYFFKTDKNKCAAWHWAEIRYGQRLGRWGGGISTENFWSGAYLASSILAHPQLIVITSDVHGPAHKKQKIRPAGRPVPLKFLGPGSAHSPPFFVWAGPWAWVGVGRPAGLFPTAHIIDFAYLKKMSLCERKHFTMHSSSLDT